MTLTLRHYAIDIIDAIIHYAITLMPLLITLIIDIIDTLFH
jgi:hypothetical protein